MRPLILVAITAAPLVLPGVAFAETRPPQQLITTLNNSLVHLGIRDANLGVLTPNQLAVIYGEVNGSGSESQRSAIIRHDLAAFEARNNLEVTRGVPVTRTAALTPTGRQDSMVATVQQIINGLGIKADASALTDAQRGQIFSLATSGDSGERSQARALIMRLIKA